MLTINTGGVELYNSATNEFTMQESYTINLEHSLVSLSKWESKWHKPFMSTEEKTSEEALDYVLCMCLTPNITKEIISGLSDKNLSIINDYISASMTATWFARQKDKATSESVTSELIYYWMIALEIPFECQYWHLNRLFTLIKVCNVKNTPGRKMSKREIVENNRSLNEKRKQAMNTKG